MVYPRIPPNIWPTLFYRGIKIACFEQHYLAPVGLELVGLERQDGPFELAHEIVVLVEHLDRHGHDSPLAV